MVQFEQLFEQSCVAARKVLLDQGRHTAQLVLETDRGVAVVVLADMPDDLDQRHAVAALAAQTARRQIGARRLLAEVFVAEAWIAQVSEGEAASGDYVRPQYRPDRREVLVVVGRDVAAAGAVRAWQGEIIRIGGDPIEVAPLPFIGEYRSPMLDAVERGWSQY